jgi:hypothetical protein
MYLCPKCGKRLAKRVCPALGAKICQLCCGRLREKEVHCVQDCPYLKSGRAYRQKRVLETSPKRPRVDPSEDKRLARLVFFVDAALAGHASAHPEFTDGDVLLAIDYAKGIVEKGRPRIIVPGAAARPVNEAGELILQALEAARPEESALVAVPASAFTAAEKTACLDWMAGNIKLEAGADLEGRAFLDNLVGIFSRMRAEQNTPLVAK